MYRIEFTNEMKRNVKLMRKRGKDISKLTDIINKLASGQFLPQSNNDHQLTDNLRDFRKCHIEPDWLLVYQIHDDILILTATATGTHSDLFGK